ncbi:MAG: hypothetical protein WCH11_04270 [Bdellovibrio sp.]
MSIIEFLFGKNPDIFDDKGQVLHKHPKRKWDAWIHRMKTDPNYNWRNHTGTQAGRTQREAAKNSK